MVYLGSSLALAVLETLVHLEVSASERAFTAIEIFLPDDAISEVGKLKKNWQYDLDYSRAMGSGWLKAGSSLALCVPSRVVSPENNVLLNPAHSALKDVQVLQQFPFDWDERLL